MRGWGSAIFCNNTRTRSKLVHVSHFATVSRKDFVFTLPIDYFIVWPIEWTFVNQEFYVRLPTRVYRKAYWKRLSLQKVTEKWTVKVSILCRPDTVSNFRTKKNHHSLLFWRIRTSYLSAPRKPAKAKQNAIIRMQIKIAGQAYTCYVILRPHFN